MIETGSITTEPVKEGSGGAGRNAGTLRLVSRLSKLSGLGILAVAFVLVLPSFALAETAALGPDRDRLTFSELMAAVPNQDGPINNGYFMPVGPSEPANHELSGVLEVPLTDSLAVPGRFPSFSVAFFTVDGHLVPVEQDIIRTTTGGWDLILSPGRVWSEPADAGWSRASFPFVLADRKWNSSHNGLATFLYNDTEVSDLQIQIVQETASWDRFDAWTRLPLSYKPGSLGNRAQLEKAFAEDLSARLPTAPLASLDADSDLIDGMERGLKDVTVTGLLDDGVLYLGPCHTRFGAYPYCDDMRNAAFSVTKTAGAALSLLWLAQKYGPQVLDLKIADYVDVTAEHDGWSDVTFRDAIDMATGIGDKAPDRISSAYDFEADEEVYLARLAAKPTARGKLDVAFLAGNYPWGPGEVGRYVTAHTFVLAAAMDAYVKSIEGPDANLWDRVTEEVLEPIGIRVAPLMHTREVDGGRGVPVMGWGFFPTVDDVAKIAQLFQDRGAKDGQQLLYGDEIDRLLQGAPDRGLPIYWQNDHGQYSYDFSFWYMPYRAEQGCDVRVPQMMGFGGNLVTLMPNGMTGFRLADASEGSPGQYDAENMAALADSLSSLCP